MENVMDDCRFIGFNKRVFLLFLVQVFFAFSSIGFILLLTLIMVTK